jgi:hypothetical protein
MVAYIAIGAESANFYENRFESLLHAPTCAADNLAIWLSSNVSQGRRYPACQLGFRYAGQRSNPPDFLYIQRFGHCFAELHPILFSH